MARRTKQSATQQAYNRNRRRIQSAIRRLENRGYLVPSNILPSIPKRITPASVRRLENITLDKIYNKSEYVVQETGEILPPSQGKKEEAKLRTEYRSRVAKENAKKRKQSKEVDYVMFDDTVLYNFEQTMNQIFINNPPLLTLIINWYNLCIQTYGKEDFAEALEKSKAVGEWPGWESISDEELLSGKLTNIINLIGGSQGVREEIMELLETGEEWNEPE